jgi:hypothetical protein
MLHTLRALQKVSSRTVSEETTNMHALTNEISARLAQSKETVGDAIIVNDVTQQPVRLQHALHLALVIHEAITLAATGRRHEPAVSPLVRVAMEPPEYKDSDELCYRLLVEDSGLPDLDDSVYETALPFTFHLIENFGGELNQDYDRGNRLEISLLFAENSVIVD